MRIERQKRSSLFSKRHIDRSQKLRDCAVVEAAFMLAICVRALLIRKVLHPCDDEAFQEDSVVAACQLLAVAHLVRKA